MSYTVFLQMPQNQYTIAASDLTQAIQCKEDHSATFDGFQLTEGQKYMYIYLVICKTYIIQIIPVSANGM